MFSLLCGIQVKIRCVSRRGAVREEKGYEEEGGGVIRDGNGGANMINVFHVYVKCHSDTCYFTQLTNANKY